MQVLLVLVASKFYRKHVLSFSAMCTCRGLFFSAISLTVAVMNHQTEILQLQSVYESISLLFISPIILKYLLFCAPRRPVPLQYEMWPPLGLTSPAPSLLRTGVAWTSFRKELTHGASPGNRNAVCPGVCFHGFTCVLRACARLAACLSSWFDNTTTHFVCVCGTGWGYVHSMCTNVEKKRRGNEIRHWMNYGACIVICRVFFRVLGRIEFVWKSRCVF